MKPNFHDKKLVSDYGRVLRKSSSKSVVDFDEKPGTNFNFQLHNINDLVREFSGVIPPNRISHYILAFIKKGQGEKTIGSYNFEIKPNMEMIFPKRVIHSTEKWSNDTTGYMLTFNEKLFEDVDFPTSFLKLYQLFRLSLKLYKILVFQDAEIAEALFSDLQNIKNESDAYHKKILAL